MVHFGPPRRGDLDLLAWGLRPADREEVRLLTRRSPYRVLRPRLLRLPHLTLSIRDDDGELLAMCGSSPSQKFPGVGTVWFLARPGIEAHSLSLTKQAGPYLDMLTLPYPLGLAAVMWGGNRMHERWAKLVGFATKGVEIRNGEEFLIIHRPSRNAQCAPPSMSPELPS